MDHQAGNFIPGGGGGLALRHPGLTRSSRGSADAIAAPPGTRSPRRAAACGLMSASSRRFRRRSSGFNAFARGSGRRRGLPPRGVLDRALHARRARRDDNDHPNPTMFPLAAHGPYYATILAPGAIVHEGRPEGQRAECRSSTAPRRRCPASTASVTVWPSPSGQAYWSGGSTWGPLRDIRLASPRRASRPSPVRGSGRE